MFIPLLSDRGFKKDRTHFTRGVCRNLYQMYIRSFFVRNRSWGKKMTIIVRRILSSFFITTQLPLLFDPIRSIKPLFFKLTKERSIVLFVTPTSVDISSAVFSEFLINIPNTAFSVLFIPTFMPTFVPTVFLLDSNTFLSNGVLHFI